MVEVVLVAAEVVVVVMELSANIFVTLMQGSDLQDLGWVDTVQRVKVLRSVVNRVDLLLGLWILRLLSGILVRLDGLDCLDLCPGYLILLLVVLLGFYRLVLLRQ